MNRRMIARILSTVLIIYAVLMVLPLITGLIYGENVRGFVTAALITAAAGLLLLSFKPRTRDIFAREGFIAVGLAWVLMGLFGALPFVFSGQIPNYIDAVFETVSGLTTTGATILNDIEGMSRSCLFWRSFNHWIGGMGVLVFIMAVLPMSGEHSMHIMRAEVPGPTVGKLVPRARETATILYVIYGALTVLETILLMLGGMSFFDALLHAFGTAGTGGFSTKNASIAAFDSVYIEMVIAVFLVLFGINFNLYYFVLIGRLKEALKSQELHWYLGIIAFSTLFIAAGISSMYDGFATALRHSFFNTMTIITTAGFGTEDFVHWPEYTQMLIVVLMFVGASAGSTGGGMKVSRVMLLFKSAAADISQIFHPRMVRRVQMDGKRVDASTARAVYVFFFIYIATILFGTFIVSFDGNDFTTNFTATLSCISNVGPGLSKVGPTGNYNVFSLFTKAVLSLIMLIGRLEIYPILILFSKSMWRRK